MKKIFGISLYNENTSLTEPKYSRIMSLATIVMELWPREYGSVTQNVNF